MHSSIKISFVPFTWIDKSYNVSGPPDEMIVIMATFDYGIIKWITVHLQIRKMTNGKNDLNLVLRWTLDIM